MKKQRPPIICANEACRRETRNYYIVHWPRPTRYYCKECHEDNVRRDARDDNRRDPPPNKE